MPPDQSAKSAPEENSKKDEGVNLDDILLPKNSAPGKTLDSASRTNAGELLQQEQNATLPKQAPVAITEQLNGKKDTEFSVPGIETYQGDIEKLVQKKNVSVVSIAAAEAARREVAAAAPTEPQETSPGVLLEWGSKLLMTAMGVLLLLLTAGISFFAYERMQPIAVLPGNASSLYISIDKVDPLVFEGGTLTRAALMSNLEEERVSLKITPGGIAQILVAQASSTVGGKPAYTPLPPERLILTLAPGAPQELLRSLTGQYLLGLHSYDGNQAFMIFSVDAYSQAFSGMLKWEPRLDSDLLPFFTHPLHPRIQTQLEAVSATTSTSTIPTPEAPQRGVFEDAVVENFDSRVLRNSDGEVTMLWTFLDAHTIVVASSEAALHEVLARRTLPQQSPR